MPIISPTAISPHRIGGKNLRSYWETRNPTGLILTVISGTQIDVTWTDAAEAADGLKLYYSSDGGANYTLGDTVAFGVEVGSITGLTAGVLYTIKLVAYKGTNESTPVADVAWTPLFILRDEFITADTAPVATPRTMEPDGGTLNLVQTDGEMAIADGKLVVPAQTSPTYGDLSAYYSTAITRATGIAFTTLVKHTVNDVGQVGGFKYAASGAFSNWNAMIYRDSYGIQITTPSGAWRRGLDAAPLHDTTQEKIYTIVLRGTGLYFFINDMLVFIEHTQSEVTSYYGFANYTNQFNIDFARFAQLPAPFNTDAGLALHSTTTPANGVTVAGSEDGNISFVWTPAENEILNIRFRWVDDDNCMILRCNEASNIIQLIRRWAGSETQFGSNLAATFNVGTAYPIYVRYFNDRIYGGVDAVGAGGIGSWFAWTTPCGFQLHSTGVKVDGFTAASRLQVYPFYVTGNNRKILSDFGNPYLPDARTRKTVSVADGGDIAAAIATMNGGDILSLAVGGTYNLDAGANGFINLPNGHSLTWTEVRGNGATIVGGAVGFYNMWGRFFGVYNLDVFEQEDYSHWMQGARDFIFEDCNFKSTSDVGYADTTHFDKCVNFVVRRCKAGPSTGAATCDGFELYGECRNGLLEDCEAEGVMHGFEIWAGASPNWSNKDITLRRCNAHDCIGGFSVEGGAQALSHENILCEDCITADNGIDGDYHADANGILYRRNSPGTVVEATGGQVIDL